MVHRRYPAAAGGAIHDSKAAAPLSARASLPTVPDSTPDPSPMSRRPLSCLGARVEESAPSLRAARRRAGSCGRPCHLTAIPEGFLQGNTNLTGTLRVGPAVQTIGARAFAPLRTRRPRPGSAGAGLAVARHHGAHLLSRSLYFPDDPPQDVAGYPANLQLSNRVTGRRTKSLHDRDESERVAVQQSAWMPYVHRPSGVLARPRHTCAGPQVFNLRGCNLPPETVQGCPPPCRSTSVPI